MYGDAGRWAIEAIETIEAIEGIALRGLGGGWRISGRVKIFLWDCKILSIFGN